MGKGSRPVRTSNKKGKKKERRKLVDTVEQSVLGTTSLIEQHIDGITITEFCNETGTVVREEDIGWQELTELCRTGVLPDAVVKAAEEKLYGKKGVPANDLGPSDVRNHFVEDYNDKFVWDPDKKDWRRRTAWDPEYDGQRDFFDPVAFETWAEGLHGFNDDVPWEEDLVSEHGGALSTMPMMTAEAAKKFCQQKEPVVDLLGRKIDKKKPNVIFLGAPEDQQAVLDTSSKIPVRIMPDHDLEFPDLVLRVFTEADNEHEESLFARMFSQAMCKKAKSVLAADVVVFGGGPDVDPALYGEARHTTTHFDPYRDSSDMDLYLLCLEHGIPMVGICRGAQFLHVMQGGKLYQHIDGHYGGHSMRDVTTGVRIERISSSHHQSVIRQDGMTVIGVSHESTERHRNNLIKEMNQSAGRTMDIEAFFYRDPCIFGVQGHPEYGGYAHYTQWFLNQLNEYVVLNPDVDWVKAEDGDCYRRLKPEYLEEAKARRVSIRNPPTPKREILKVKQETK